jgi:TetR/AcrR family transcriptional repressor of nem operon
MRITKQKAAENRERVVSEAARLFREKGFDGVGVAELMAAAGLTHGGFYNHFGSKDDIEAAACGHVFDQALARIAAIAEEPDADARARKFEDYRAGYVSAKARDASAARCPMVAFASDVSRQSEPVREAYAKGLAAYLESFQAASGLPRDEALRLFSGLVGALTLARSVAATDRALSDEILGAAVSADAWP